MGNGLYRAVLLYTCLPVTVDKRVIGCGLGVPSRGTVHCLYSASVRMYNLTGLYVRAI